MITIDAKNRTLGRVASEAAKALIGKNSVHFAKNVVLDEEVKIENAAKTIISETKKKGEVFVRYSGHPGGIKRETLGELLSRRGFGEVYRRTVYGMLPKNKLRDQRIKNLTVTE